MDRTLSIQEQINDFWKYGTYFAAAVSLLFAILFWNMPDPLWAGIFRLAAFIFFSFAVFGILKQLGGPLHLTITPTPEYLLIEYRKKDKKVHQEKIERRTILEFAVAEEEPPWQIGRLYPRKLSTLLVCFKDDDQRIPLFEHDGRTLFFDTQTIIKTEHFLEDIISEGYLHGQPADNKDNR